MRPIVLIFVAVMAVSTMAFGQANEKRFLLMSKERLEQAKNGAFPGHAKALDTLRKEADALLIMEKLPSVTNNEYVGPGGTKHDYVSFGPYWWPDPEKPDGLPFIRRDGKVNREQLRVENGHDRPELYRMIAAVKTLALARRLTGEERYGTQAARILRCWFFDSETKMNPNLNFGQAIPGRTHGRGVGIIDTMILADLPDAVTLLDGCPDWSAADGKELERWFSDYLDWLLESKHGKDEGRAGNNHGTWYDVQVVMFALFVGRDDLARRTLENVRKRIETQIETDGRQPLELRRTRPFTYSTMNLRGFVILARLAERFEIDLWSYRSEKGGSIRDAYEYLRSFTEKDAAWPYKDLDFPNPAASKASAFETTRRLAEFRLGKRRPETVEKYSSEFFCY